VRRRDKTLESIDRSMRIIELGPLDKPLVAKRDGWKTFVVDRAGREELIEKYRDDSNVDVNLIEEVDAVWRDGRLVDAIPEQERGTFAACIASHVIEHLPDPTGFLQSLELILNATGVVSLVVPDKRFCFDFFKHVSSVGELLAAHERAGRNHPRGTRFDYEAYTVTNRGEICWSQGRQVMDIAFVHSLDDAKAAFDAHSESDRDEYVDMHAWHFTPNSFELAMLELGALGEIDFQIAHLHPTAGCEFHVTLRRGRPTLSEDQLNARRLELLGATLADVREQADLLDSKESVPGRMTAFGRRVTSGMRSSQQT
jgi:SAM-dependent methyltransferase